MLRCCGRRVGRRSYSGAYRRANGCRRVSFCRSHRSEHCAHCSTACARCAWTVDRVVCHTAERLSNQVGSVAARRVVCTSTSSVWSVSRCVATSARALHGARHGQIGVGGQKCTGRHLPNFELSPSARTYRALSTGESLSIARCLLLISPAQDEFASEPVPKSIAPALLKMAKAEEKARKGVTLPITADAERVFDLELDAPAKK